jgi:hypothetical protein
MLKGLKAKARCFSQEKRFAKVDTPRRRVTTGEDGEAGILAASLQILKTLRSA